MGGLLNRALGDIAREEYTWGLLNRALGDIARERVFVLRIFKVTSLIQVRGLVIALCRAPKNVKKQFLP